MPTYQDGSNILVAIKRETTVGVAAAAGAGATELRILASPGLALKRANIQSMERRPDLLKTMPRLGARTVDGSYSAELTVGGGTDLMLEAIMRSTWSPALTTLASVFTTLATTTSTITGVAGSFLTTGIRVGDIINLTGTATPANNNVNLRVTAVTATVITVAGTPLTVAAADGTGSLVRLKKLINGATAVRYSHTVDQFSRDLGLSEQFLGCRLVGCKLSLKPGAMATVQYTFMGIDRVGLPGGSSPYFTSPSLTTGLDLIADDSAIRYNGINVVAFNGIDIDFTIAAKLEPVIGSFTSPDVFDNLMNVTASISALRSDFSNLVLFDAETEFELSVLLQEPTGSPKGCLAMFLPRVKIGALSAPIAGDGAMTETVPLLVGAKVLTAGYDATLATFSSSAP